METTAHELNLTDELDSRRDFLAKMGKGVLFVSLGMFGAGCEAVDRGLLGRGLTPVVLVEAQAAGLPKSNMLVHSQNPFNGEFAPHLLNDDVTPTVRHFVRNNSGIPERAVKKDLHGWKLVVDGEVHKDFIPLIHPNRRLTAISLITESLRSWRTDNYLDRILF